MPHPVHVLIVEDSEDDAELMVAELMGYGFDVSSERVQTESRYLAGLQTQPDVILADYQLPCFSGARALELLNEHHINIPLILVSGMLDDDLAADLVNDGAAGFLEKNCLAWLGPMVARVLLEKVTPHL